ncbi:MAG: KilA-N domain-containing protein [Saprospiraceae bacterium]|nr:KilA-N domain-containing protein [Saprospiraceae bacterium]
MAKRTILVDGKNITLLTQDDEDYISLTDIAKLSDEEPRFVIRNWLSTQNTIAYLGAWEGLHNPEFNRAGFRTVKDEFFEKPFSLTPTRWIEATKAIGMRSTSGKHSGGTYAHKDIALNFCYWLSPTFQIYLIKEFQRLKQDESDRLNLEWNLKRTLAKINYRFHTDAIKMYLVPPKLQQTQQEGIAYASEADMLNLALFGMTAKQWHESNPTLKGNIRDYATAEQLLVLANLENLNAHLIKEGMKQSERLNKLNDVAIYQMELLTSSNVMTGINQLEKGKAPKLPHGEAFKNTEG